MNKQKLSILLTQLNDASIFNQGSQTITLFKEVIEAILEEPEHTFTVPNSSGTYTQPNTNNPVVIN